ncbi:MAG: hypothetical protein K2I96_09005 [Lachnospiraceae bacterium]|nr:hypothetical protein [Lachnospiraceae bacterium]
MLDKFDGSDVKDMEKEETEKVKAAEETKAPEAAVAAEETKAPETAVTAEEKETAKKGGYLSEIDGVEVDFELQYREHETDMRDIAKRVTEDYARRGNDASRIELIQVYLKPTDFTAYYVINNSYEGKIPLF